MGGRGGGAGPRGVSSTVTRLNPEEWSALASATWNNLGRRGADAAWSPNTFLTQWGKMPKSTKRILFQGTGFEDVTPMIDDLVRLSGAAKTSSGLMNKSNTAGATASSVLIGSLGALVGGTPGAGASLVGGVMSSYAASKAFTNPKFVRGLTLGIRILDQNPNALPAVVARLGATLADEDEDVQAWFESTIGSLGN